MTNMNTTTKETAMNSTADQMVNILRFHIRTYRGDIRTAFHAVSIIHGMDYASSAMKAYEDAKWLRTPSGSKISIDPEFAKEWE